MVAIERGAADAMAAVAAERAVQNAERPLHLGQIHDGVGVVAAGTARDQPVPDSADPLFHFSIPPRLDYAPGAAP